MTRDESKVMQGVAILMMIFYHTFNPNDIQENFGAVVQGLAAANNPVPLYALLSGYGFYKVYCRKQEDKHRVSRSFRLYAVYWITLTAFLAIGVLGGGIFAKFELIEHSKELHWLAVYILSAFMVCSSIRDSCSRVSLDYEGH